MAKIAVTLSARLPVWWRPALHATVALVRLRIWLGQPVDIDAECEAFGARVLRHTRMEAN